MNRLRDSIGRFVKNLVKPPHSPSLSSETFYETKSRDTHSEPHNKQPHDNHLYGNRSWQDYLHPPRITTPSCIMFPPDV